MGHFTLLLLHPQKLRDKTAILSELAIIWRSFFGANIPNRLTTQTSFTSFLLNLNENTPILLFNGVQFVDFIFRCSN